VDDVREIRDKVGFQPSELKYKVYIIDEVHMLSVPAFNALLKTLEEPPAHIIFILATTDPQKIPPTVLSRCQRFNFKRVPVDKIVMRLHTLCDKEGIDADEQALRLIARYASGALRDAESLLDQLSASNSLRITANDVREALGATDASTVKALVDGLIRKDPSAGFEAIQAAIDQGADARQVAKQMVDYLRALMQVKASQGKVAGGSGDLSEAEKLEMSQHAEKVSLGLLSKATRSFSTAINDMRSTTDAQLPLEMAYLDCIVEEDATAIGQPRRQEIGDKGDRIVERVVVREIPPQPVAAKTAPVTLPTPAPSTQNAPQPAELTEPQKAATNGAAGHAAFEQLNTGWGQFLKEVKPVSSPVHSLLTYCQLFEVTGGVVKLKANHDLTRTRLEDPKNKAVLIGALNKFLGGKYAVQIFVGQPPVEPEEDPVLKAAKRLGGTIRE
jgi:DNA polymerase-3 subunit gamma/tau